MYNNPLCSSHDGLSTTAPLPPAHRYLPTEPCAPPGPGWRMSAATAPANLLLWTGGPGNTNRNHHHHRGIIRSDPERAPWSPVIWSR